MLDSVALCDILGSFLRQTSDIYCDIVFCKILILWIFVYTSYDMASDISPTTLLENTLRRRISVPAREMHAVFASTGLTARTLQRAVATHPRVVRLGETSQTRYALTREVLGLGDRFPLSLIHSDGRIERVATLVALQDDHWAVQAKDLAYIPRYGQIGSEEGSFHGLPWYLSGWRPDGFVGRNLVRRYATILGAPADLKRWTDDHVVLANARGVIDPPGNWVLGETLPPGSGEETVALDARAAIYAERAERATLGGPTGSSAGGEQPKFTAIVRRPEGPVHVLVKFSPPRGERVGDRWADLLVCEHLAAEVLMGHGIHTPRTEIIEAQSRLCLEVERFDRHGLSGRSGTASLMALSPPLGGPANNWTADAGFLRDKGLVGEREVQSIAFVDSFGDRIGNTDRHLGNLALLIDNGPPFRLAPNYDMLPMSLRPTAHGELPAVQLPAAIADPKALAIARQYWHRVAQNPLITAPFREGAARVAQELG
jgi:HipA-like C-terminal domain